MNKKGETWKMILIVIIFLIILIWMLLTGFFSDPLGWFRNLAQ
ncbi:MAG: hypothetical protein Q8Q42_00995 [Nanoarchaeota archaeon]|nr:hypothetical protein [Nanoarchaeota archaeon]